jgi:hypothetical protein
MSNVMSSTLRSSHAVRRVLPALFLAASVGSARAATVEIKVTSPEGEAVSGATVTLVPANLSGTSGDHGLVRLEDVPPGVYDAVARQAGFTAARADLEVGEAGTVSAEIQLLKRLHFSETVSVSPNT